MIDKKTYIERRGNLRRKFKSGILLFVGNTILPMSYASNGYRFIQDSNFLYYFGLDNPGYVGVMDIDADNDCIYGDDPTIEDKVWTGDLPPLSLLAEGVGIRSTAPLSTLNSVITMAIKAGRKIHFTPPYRAEQQLTLSTLLSINPLALASYSSEELVRAIIAMREIKSSDEIAQISAACDVGYLMHTKVMEMCREGVKEKEIVGVIDGIAMSRGKGVSFETILTQRGETLHNHMHDKVLRNGNLLLTDAGSLSNSGYCSDFTRTIPVSGKFSARQRDVYDILVRSHLKALELIKPNVSYKDIHLDVCREICEGFIDLGIMKGDATQAAACGAVALFMPHGLGHQLGMDVHDMEGLGEDFVGYDSEIERSNQFGTAYLRMGKRLKQGHVITVEPGIYFIPALITKWREEKLNQRFINYDKAMEYLDFGGMRLENDVVVTQNGCSILGKHRIPFTADEIEEYMAQFN